MLEYGICLYSLAPVRSEARHAAEMVNQLLFGELYTIHEKQGEWLRIESHHDHYPGFIHHLQHHALSEKQYKELADSDRSFTLDLAHSIQEGSLKFPVCLGSTLYQFDGMHARVGKHKFIFSGKSISPSAVIDPASLVAKVSQRFIHTPYLWGGRSAFGIDCSGFVQVVYKVAGFNLPRDAWQQAAEGKTIMFIHEAKQGDLAFFENEEGKIIHTGIILEGQRIIHASGSVRIDPIDHYGIYHQESRKYSHRLRILKRLL